MQANGYKGTGCYNLRCPGFVQTSKTFALGGALSPASTYNGQQIEITLLIYKVIFYSNYQIDFGLWIIWLISRLPPLVLLEATHEGVF